jgi:hypothetical protein
MPECHIIVWIDRYDYEHIQRAYARLHLTPSQIVRIAVDRFLTEGRYRQQHPFAVPQSIDRDSGAEEFEPWYGVDDPPTRRPGHAEVGTKVSFRIDRGRRDTLREILHEPYGLGAFVRGAMVSPGIVLDSRYIDERFRDLVGDTEHLLRRWHYAPADSVYDVGLIDAQVDMSKRRGAVLKRR